MKLFVSRSMPSLTWHYILGVARAPTSHMPRKSGNSFIYLPTTTWIYSISCPRMQAFLMPWGLKGLHGPPRGILKAINSGIFRGFTAVSSQHTGSRLSILRLMLSKRPLGNEGLLARLLLWISLPTLTGSNESSDGLFEVRGLHKLFFCFSPVFFCV